MAQLNTRRVRWTLSGEVVEQDAYCCTPEEWTALVNDYPSLSSWAVFRFAERGLVTAVSPLVGMVTEVPAGARI